MAQADGTVTIVLNGKDANFLSTVEKAAKSAKEKLSSVGDGAGDKISTNTKKNMNKAVEDVTSGKAKIDAKLKKGAEINIDDTKGKTKIKDFTAYMKGILGIKKTTINAEIKGNASKEIKAIMADRKSLDGKRFTIKGATSGNVNRTLKMTKKDADNLAKKHINIKMTETGNADEKIKQTKDDLDKTNKSASRLKDIIKGTVVGNAITGGLAAVQAGFEKIVDLTKEALNEAVAYTKEQQVMTQAWTTLTGSSSKANGMVDTINQLAIKTGQATDTVNELEQGFYHLHSSKSEADDLSKAMLNMSDAVGLSGDQIKAASQDMVHSLSGNITTGDLNVISQYFPMFNESLLKYERKITGNAKLTMAQMRKMASAGKISGKDYEKVFENLGNVKYSKASENMLKTITGMERTIKARVPALVSALTTPFLNASNPVYGAVSKWVSSSKATKEFDKLGETLAKSVKTVTTSLSKAVDIKAFNPDSIMKKITSAVSSLASGIASHSKEIVNFFKGLWSAIKILGDVGTGFAKGIVDGIKMLLTPIAKLASGKKTVNGLSDALNDLAKHKGALETFGKVLGGMWVTAKVAKATKSFADFYKNLYKISKVKLTSVANSIKDLFGKGDGTSSIGKTITFIKSLSKAERAEAKATGTETAAQKLLNKVLSTNIWVKVAVAVAAVIAVLVELYKHNKKFRDFVNGLVKWTKKAIPQVVQWFEKLYDGAVKWIKKTASDVKKSWGNLWDDVISLFKDAWKDIKDVLTIFYDIFTGKWSKLGKDIKKLVKDLWSTVKDYFKAAYDYLNDLTGGRLGKMVDLFSAAWKKIKSGWHSMWNGIGTFFKGIWKDIKGFAQDGINDVIAVINAGINGIDKVISAFGGKKKAIGDISKVHFATGTTETRRINTLTHAVVNDGADVAGGGNKEIILHHNGDVEPIYGRNVQRELMPGDEVLNATEAKYAAPALGLTHFASGTGAWDSIKSMFGTAASWVKDKTTALAHFVAHPIKSLESLWSSITKFSGSDFIETFGTAIGTKFMKSIESKFSSLISGLGDDAGGTESNPSGSSVTRWKPYVIKALKANGFSATASQISAWMRVIARESNGNPKAINLWDSNAKAGHPSMGLVQTIQSTFDAYKFAGHSHIYNGYDDLLAGINYMKHIYGKGASAFARVSGPEGYANGGVVDKLTHAIIGEDPLYPHETIVNEAKPTADGLLSESISERAKKDPNGLYANLISATKLAANAKTDMTTSVNNTATNPTSDSTTIKTLTDAIKSVATQGNVYLGVQKVGNVIRKNSTNKTKNDAFWAGQAVTR
ncbi:tape measure protein [Lactiplantibacillus fabifermentans]|uniref:Phage-related minor tail protein n=1 Tax=Lactiplantibacillus fabifermentans DSM 21115 TaxID=1413187 RepID=A0A0R2NS47_9LACO|nr:tape measure protein [Lactiplantibacillus fabifermentans]KRO28469.1 phage-related minor tail protein [Lactiplantibacillus fabifermentans DSM 21115]